MSGYFSEWKTQIYSYNRQGGWLRLRQEFPGVIPFLTASPIEPGNTSSAGALFPVLMGQEQNKHGLYLRTKAGNLQFAALSGASDCGERLEAALPQETVKARTGSEAENDKAQKFFLQIALSGA